MSSGSRHEAHSSRCAVASSERGNKGCTRRIPSWGSCINSVCVASRAEIAGANPGTNLRHCEYAEQTAASSPIAAQPSLWTTPRGLSFAIASNMTASHQTDATNPAVPAGRQLAPRCMSRETKSAFKTTEFVICLLAVLCVLVASLLVKHTSEHLDYFSRRDSRDATPALKCDNLRTRLFASRSRTMIGKRPALGRPRITAFR